MRSPHGGRQVADIGIFLTAVGCPCYVCFRAMRARVLVTLRPGVLDPAGQAVSDSLNQLGFDEVRAVRIGKVLEFDLDDLPADRAEARLRAMSRKLLANTVIEDFRIELPSEPGD